MTRDEYEERLAKFHRRARTILRRGLFIVLPATVIFMAWQIWYIRPIALARRQRSPVMHRYSLPGYTAPPAQPLPSNSEVLTALGTGLAIYVALVGGFIRFGILNTAPRCGHCGKILAFSTRKQVLSTGRCPRCQQPLF